MNLFLLVGVSGAGKTTLCKACEEVQAQHLLYVDANAVKRRLLREQNPTADERPLSGLDQELTTRINTRFYAELVSKSTAFNGLKAMLVDTHLTYLRPDTTEEFVKLTPRGILREPEYRDVKGIILLEADADTIQCRRQEAGRERDLRREPDLMRIWRELKMEAFEARLLSELYRIPLLTLSTNGLSVELLREFVLEFLGC